QHWIQKYRSQYAGVVTTSPAIGGQPSHPIWAKIKPKRTKPSTNWKEREKSKPKSQQ
nr:hypothetical protein [Tanacetum cinerariifolium]